MKRLAPITLSIIITLLTGSAFAGVKELHDWTSTAGSTIRAEFMRLEGGKVTLLSENGKQLVLRLDQLDKKSQQRAERLAELGEADPDEVEADAKYRVPLFKEGPWKGYHAVYEREKFFAAATRSGQIRVFQKVDGKRIKGKQPALFRLSPHYHVAVTEGREVVYVETDGQPTMDPDELTFKGKTAAGMTFQVTFVFEDDSIEAYGFIKDRGNVEHPTRLNVGMRFPKNKKITPDMGVEEQTKIVGDSWIKGETRDGDEVEFDFVTEVGFKKHPGMTRGMKTVTVKHADCGPHLFTFTPPEREHGHLSLWNASTIAPHAGFSVPLHRKETGNRSAKTATRVTIEQLGASKKPF